MLVFINAKRFTNSVRILTVLLLATIAGSARAEWNIDFSRRVQKAPEADLNRAAAQERATNTERSPASVSTVNQINDRDEDSDHGLGLSSPKTKGVIDAFFDQGEPVQDIVILQTEHGFVPSVVRVRKNGHYRVSVVNVNEKEKNVSFILDAFSEHHATFYGKIKTFILEPKKEGAYSFQSPETSAEGKVIVFNPQLSARAPATALGEEK